MADGVQFDAASAARIGDVVRRVEAMPMDTPQRRRRRDYGSGKTVMPFDVSSSGGDLYVAEGTIWVMGKGAYTILADTVTPVVGAGYLFIQFSKGFDDPSGLNGPEWRSSEPTGMGAFYEFVLGTYTKIDDVVTFRRTRPRGDIEIMSLML
jgi:hypothetical protein